MHILFALLIKGAILVEPFFHFFAYLNTSMIERIPWLFWNCFDPLVHQHKHDKTTMFFVRFLFLGKWRGNWRGGFRIEKWGPCLLWTGNFIGSVDSISLDYKRDVKKKKSQSNSYWTVFHIPCQALIWMNVECTRVKCVCDWLPTIRNCEWWMVIMLDAFYGSLFALCGGVALERPGQTSTYTRTLPSAWVRTLRGHIKLKQC